MKQEASHQPIDNEEREERLQLAVQTAIEQSQQVFQELQQNIDNSISHLEYATQTLKPWNFKEEEAENQANVAQKFVSKVKTASKEVESLFERQKEGLSSFKVVMFGRTGTGKSTLMEVFTKGNGDTISLGNADWTTDINPNTWKSCVFIDTPGVEGWGRTKSRTELEEIAHQAVETADLVFLCFDSGNHTAAELKQVSEWVEKYGKPAIVVLNNRNPRWRMPEAVTTTSKRKNLSRKVTEQVGSLREELEKIGLFPIPIVVLNSQRALYARLTEPFKGPYQQDRKKEVLEERENHGVKNLEEFSNFPALENLIIETISSDATELRLGMLREQTCSVLKGLISELHQLREDAKEASLEVEKLIKRILNIVGSSEPYFRKLFDRDSINLISKLEELRTTTFQLPKEGEFEKHIKQVFSAELGSLQNESLSKGQELISDAFENKTKFSHKDAAQQIFKQDEIQKASEKVLQDGIEFLGRKLKLEISQTKSDITCLINSSTIDGQSGQGWRWFGNAAKGAGFLGGAAATLGGFAILNWWNPLGWATGVAFGVAVGGGIASTILSWIGGRSWYEAEKKRLSEKRKAIKKIRQNIKEVYNRQLQEIIKKAKEYSQDAVSECLSPLFHEAIALRFVQQETLSSEHYLEEILKKIPPRIPAQQLLSQAMQSVENKLFPNDSAASRKLWLGEEWITDPTGLTAQDDRLINSQPQGEFHQSFRQVFSKFTHLNNSLALDVGSQWIKEVEQVLHYDKQLPIEDEILNLTKELKDILNSGKARFSLYGDWNTGKTSFIKRLLIESQQSIPESLEIKHNPTTTKIHEYEWEGIFLVDNPGFQSTRIEDTHKALSSLPDATAILYLMSAKLITGDFSTIDLILKGNEEQGILTKLERTFFIINRTDELGIDPSQSPDEYGRLCKRKQEELILAFKSRGVKITAQQIFFMSSDPYHLVDHQQEVNLSHFDPYHSWDGFEDFIEDFSAVKDYILAIGAHLSVLEGGVFRLSQLIIQIKSDRENLAKKQKSIQRLNQILEDADRESEQIKREISQKLKYLVYNHAFGILEDTLSAVSETEIKAQAEQLSKWWNEPTFKEEVKEYLQQTRRDIDAWQQNTQDDLDRQINSGEFQLVFPELADKLSTAQDLAPNKGKFLRALRDLAKNFRLVSKEVVSWAGNALKIGEGAMKPFTEAIPFLPLVGFVLEIASIVDSNKKAQKRDEARKSIEQSLQETAQSYCSALLKEDEEGASIISYLKKYQNSFQRLRQECQSELKNIQEQINDQDNQMQKYEYLKKSALNKLPIVH